MDTAPVTNDEELNFIALTDRRRTISKAGRLHWFHWVGVALSLVVTVGAWRFSSNQIAQQTEARFEREADQVLELVSERMHKYELGLWGGVSALQASGRAMNYNEWLTFANHLRIDVKYPGINGIGVIHNIAPVQLSSYVFASLNWPISLI